MATADRTRLSIQTLDEIKTLPRLAKWFESLADFFETYPVQILVCYFVGHIIFRSLLPMPIGFDEGEQLIVTQDLALGYNSQPPLYNWLQYGCFQLFGTNQFAMIVLKQSMLLGIFLTVFAAWRKSGLSIALAAACTFSMALITEVGWELQRTRTHLAAAVLMASLFVLVSFHIFQMNKRASCLRRGSLYGSLGLIVGLGALAKYNFIVFPVSIAISALFMKPFRSCILTPWVLLTIAVAILIELPHGYWVVENGALLASGSNDKFGLSAELGFLSPRIQGLQSFGKKLFMFYLQALGLIAIMLFDWRDWKFSNSKIFSGLTESAKRHVNLVGVASLTAIGLSLLVAQLSGMTLFKSRWLVPAAFLSIGPLLLRTRILFGPNVRRLYWMIVLVCFMISTIAIVKGALDGYESKGDFANLPILDGAVWETVSAEPSDAVVITDDPRVAALVRMKEPEITIVSPGYRVPDLPVDGPIVVIAETNNCQLADEVLKLISDKFPSCEIGQMVILESTGDQMSDDEPWCTVPVR